MRIAPILIAFALVLAVGCPAAHAASIAYVANGEVWLSSLDGAQKVRLAVPVVNVSGETEKWLDVAASDGGRIVAVRNVPGADPRLSSFKVWEPDGTSTVGGPLSAPSGWVTYDYPLGFDITADGQHMVYGYSNVGLCCPESSGQGTYVRPVSTSALAPINLAGSEHPTILGDRVIAHDDAVVEVQDAGTTYGTTFVQWLDTALIGLEVRRTDIAANGQLAALEFVQSIGGTQTIGAIDVMSIQGVDQSPAFPSAVDCFLPASGIASAASFSQDARLVAWTDADGLKVAGVPTTDADPCVLSSPPVVISATGSHGAIGGANAAAFLPTPTPTPAPTSTLTLTPTPTVVATPTLTLVRANPQPKIATATLRRSKRTVTIGGSVAASATGKVKVVLAYASGKAKRSKTVTLTISRGRFSGRIKLSSADARKAQKLTVTVTFPGDATFAAASKTAKIKVKR